MNRNVCLNLVLWLMVAGGPAATAADEDLPAAPGKVRPLLVGTPIPDVTLKRIDGTPVKLKQVVSERPAFLVFYRGGW